MEHEAWIMIRYWIEWNKWATAKTSEIIGIDELQWLINFIYVSNKTRSECHFESYVGAIQCENINFGRGAWNLWWHSKAEANANADVEAEIV